MSLASLRKEWQRAITIRGSATTREVPEDRVQFAEMVGIDPDPWQEEVLVSEHKRKALLCGRQTGKSTVSALLSIHKALTQPGSVVLIVAPGERQAKLAYRKALTFYRVAGYPLPAHSERKTGLELANGSIIEALPAVERTTRGYSVDLLVVDEAGAVHDLDYHGILPALIATKGEQVLLGTPRGKRGFFFETWHSEQDWMRVTVRSDEVERITEEDLEPFRATMPEEYFRQEFYCEWLELEGGLFSYEDIQMALAVGDDVETLQSVEGDEEW